jgi:uncharacterized protein (TIGR03032 family)
MAADTPQLEITCSRQFPEWMAERRVSLAFTTYQTGKLFMIGLQPSGRLSIFERTFNRCMGLYGDGQTLWMSTLYQLWRLENVVVSGQLTSEGYDRLYVPQVGYTTGDVDTHDIVVTDEGQVVFANTLFNCLATISHTHSFAPIWKPRFISKLAAEDRCHMNGIALDRGKPRYVSAVSQSDIVDGWRDRRRDGGCVIDIESNELVSSGLSMPHSPRVYREQLWLLNSGTGDFGRIDRSTGRFEPLAFCAGYLRGMAFTDDFAVV